VNHVARKTVLLLLLVALAIVAAQLQLFDFHSLDVQQGRGFFDN
jgi:hypothetical protein